MWFGIGVVITIAGIIINWRSTYAGLILYWVWYLVRPQETWVGLGGSIPMERIFALCLIAGTLIRYVIKKKTRIKLSPAMKAFAALIVVNYLTAVTSIWRSNTLDIANKFGKLFIFFICASIIIDTPRRLRIFLWTYVLCISWEAGSTIYNYYAHPYFAEGIQRAEGLTASWGDPDGEAFNMLLAIPFVLALGKATEKKKLAYLLYGVPILCIAAMVLTGSRMAMLVLAVAFILMTLRSKRAFLMVPGLLLASVVAWFLIPARYQERLAATFAFVDDPTIDTSAGESAYGRVIGFKISMMIFRDFPILGVGAGNFPDAWFTFKYSYDGQTGLWHQPHNLPGQILSEQGIVGGIAFIVFLVVMFRGSAEAGRMLSRLRAPPPLLLAVQKMIPIVLICVLLQGFSSHCYYRYNWYLACGLLDIIYRFALKGAVAAETGESPIASRPAPLELQPVVAGWRASVSNRATARIFHKRGRTRAPVKPFRQDT